MRVRIVTWNIHGGRNAGDRLDLAAIADTLRSILPDVAALQEVDAYQPRSGHAVQWRALADATGMAAVYGANLWQPVGGEQPPAGHAGIWRPQYGNALLTRFPVRTGENHWLRGSDGGAEQRGCLEVDAGPAVWLCTHLGLQQRERALQADDLAAIAARRPGPLVLAGDFNAVSVAPEMLALRSAWRDAGAGAGPTSPSGQPRQRIDYVFLPPSWRVVAAEVVETSASDHRPVVITAEVD